MKRKTDYSYDTVSIKYINENNNGAHIHIKLKENLLTGEFYIGYCDTYLIVAKNETKTYGDQLVSRVIIYDLKVINEMSRDDL
jgi:hypothetical protein